MSSHIANQHHPDIDGRDEYPQVTQANLDRAKFRVGLQPTPNMDEIERMQLANSAKLRLILDEAEARIRATGGIKHEDFWRQLDAEYQDTEAQGYLLATEDNK
jgi:hypothetical protein